MFYSTLNGGDTKTLSALVSKVNASKDAERQRERQVGFIGVVTTSEACTTGHFTASKDSTSPKISSISR